MSGCDASEARAPGDGDGTLVRADGVAVCGADSRDAAGGAACEVTEPRAAQPATQTMTASRKAEVVTMGEC